MQLTEKQQSAVAIRNKNILVSAAAGSGKTGVLTRRIVQLCEEGADVRRMLVCTFTNAAAAEMRERICAHLMQRAEETGNIRLRAQAEYVASADICTIHKFCMKLLRENFLALGLPQRWRPASDQNAKNMADQAMEETFAALFEEQEARFLRLIQCFADRNDENLKKMLLHLYAFSMSMIEGIDWMVTLSRDVVDARLQEMYLQKYARIFEDMLESYDACSRISEAQGWGAQRQKDEAEFCQAKEIADAFARGDYQSVKVLLDAAKPIRRKSGLLPKEAVTRHEACKNAARELKKSIKTIAVSGVSDLRQEVAYMVEQSQALYYVLQRFEERYRALKRAQGALTYDDMIRLAASGLQDEALAESYRQRYDYIFVDEYQDTNPIQDALIERISRANNRFMVGDIKQSIYRFRMADPQIFRDKLDEYAGRTEDVELIHMNDNFRSAPQVIDAVNLAMSRLMCRKFGDIDYTKEEMLVARAAIEGSASLLLVEAGAGAKDSAVLEAKGIAREILQLVKEGRKFSDIVVLLRAVKDDGPVFRRVFAEYGIPAQGRDVQALPPEVELFLCLLELVDNANSDIALLSVMRSHLGRFDEEELAAIRASHSEGSFYEALCAHIAQELPGLSLIHISEPTRP